jgi:lipopolysaccharide exporter
MILKINNRIFNTVRKNTVVLTAGTLIAQIIGISVTPILSRIYTPSDYGLLAIFSAFVAICSTLITMRYETRILLPKSEEESKKIMQLVILMSIFIGGILILLSSYLVSESLLKIMRLSELGPWINTAIAASVATAIIGVITNWLNRLTKYVTISILRILQASLSAIAGLTFGITMMNEGLLYAQSVALLLTLIVVIVIAHTSINKKISFAELMNTAKIHKRAPLYLLPTAIVDIVTLQLPFFLISIWFSNTMTGNYRMAYSLLLLPASLVGTSIAQIFAQKYSNIWPDATASKLILIKTWKYLAVFGFVPMITIILFGEQIFEKALGKDWIQAGQIASVMAPMVFASLIHSPTSSTLTVMGMERIGFFLALTVVIYRPLSFYIGYLYNDFFLGLALYSFFEIMHFIIFQALAMRKINNTIRLNDTK